MALTGDPLGALEAALDDQKSSILSGAFDRLEGIEARIEAALAVLTSHKPDRRVMARLDRIKARAARQGRLLQAALRGVQDARQARQAGRGFTSYDSQGRAGQIGSPRPRFERRS